MSKLQNQDVRKLQRTQPHDEKTLQDTAELVLNGITFDEGSTYKKQYEGRNLIVPTPVKKKIERTTKKMRTLQM